MNLPNNSKVAEIAVVCAMAGAFLVGYYVGDKNQPPVQTDAKHTTDTRQIDTTKETQVVVIEEPGKKTTTKTIKEKKTETKDKVKNESSVKVSPPSPKRWNVSALVAVEPKDGLSPIYGVSVSKEILGPFTVGAFGLTNGTFGVSVGVNF